MAPSPCYKILVDTSSQAERTNSFAQFMNDPTAILLLTKATAHGYISDKIYVRIYLYLPENAALLDYSTGVIVHVLTREEYEEHIAQIHYKFTNSDF
jgi:hypothetical protein